jgi:hypothetical protein
MPDLLTKLQSSFPELTFKSGKQFCWSPESNTIVYKQSAKGKVANWSLLHETGHALLKHQNYKADFELLKLEIDAWSKARELAELFNIKIDEEHVEDCLDTYRDWLHKRSVCPSCSTQCLQQADYIHYRCHNCHSTWKVTASRFCRSYRTSKNVAKIPVLHLEPSLVI